MFQFNRRQCLQSLAGGLAGFGASSWLSPFGRVLAGNMRSSKHVILLWMSGGPSQLDTFDLKPEHENGGEFAPIDTNVPGVQISEHLPLLAQQADKLAIIRSLHTTEGDHTRGTQLVHTGHRPNNPILYPTIGASLSKELQPASGTLPSFMSVGGNGLFGPAGNSPGFLGPAYAPLALVGQELPNQPEQQESTESAPSEESDNETNSTPAQPQFAQLRVEDLSLPDSITTESNDQRTRLWNSLQSDFLKRHADSLSARSHNTVYQRALQMMNGPAQKVFDLSEESVEQRLAYGPGLFGQSCLMARRLVEAGVSFVEVPFSLGANWDTHANNFESVKTLSNQLDQGWSALMTDLAERGLLESTTILWIGEFGRTPKINDNAGRDHFNNAWSCVFAGGGISGGQVYGQTTEDGMAVKENQAEIGDVLSTLCLAAGVSPDITNNSNVDRPIAIAEGMPLEGVLSV